MHNIGVIHGRFQVLHKDHLKYLLAGAKRCRHLVIGITNPDPRLTRKDEADPDRSDPAANPLTYYERQWIMKETLMEAGLEAASFSVVPLPINIPELYRYYVPMDGVFFLTIYDQWGEKKLEMFSELGLKTEIMWRRPQSQKGISASMVRQMIANNLPGWEELVPPTCARILHDLDISQRLRESPGQGDRPPSP